MYLNLVCLIFIVGECKLAQSVEDDKIIGGVPTGLIPFMVSVQRSGKHYCGGMLLSFQTTLTACHCLGELRFAPGNDTVQTLHQHPTSIYLLQAGDWSLYLKNDHAQRRPASAFHPHSACAKKNGVLAFDYGLIEVKDPFIRTQYVRPLKLRLDKEHYRQRSKQIAERSEICWVMGWGKKDVDPKSPHSTEFLKKAKMRLIDDNKCRQFLSSQNIVFTSYNFSENGQVCAVGVNWQDSDCTGDSGGPVWCKDTVMAIVSYGFDCGRGDQPAVYAKVENFLDWYNQKRKEIVIRQSASVGIPGLRPVNALFLFVYEAVLIMRLENIRF